MTLVKKNQDCPSSLQKHDSLCTKSSEIRFSLKQTISSIRALKENRKKQKLFLEVILTALPEKGSS